MIRRAVAADIAGMHALRLAVRENRLTRPQSISAADYRPFVQAGSAWVADDSGAVRGFAALDAEAGTVWALFVAPDAEGQGIGGALHDRMIDDAAARGLNGLKLTTEAGTRAECFYEARGWALAGPTGNGEVAMTFAVKPASETE